MENKERLAGSPAGSPATFNEKLATIQLPAQELSGGVQSIHLAIVAPSGFEFSAGAPWSAALSGDGQLKILDPPLNGEAAAGGRVELQARAEVNGPTAALSVQVHANICERRQSRRLLPWCGRATRC